MGYQEIPSDQDVVKALRSLGDGITALKLCEQLEEDGYPRRDSQLAIQRAAERGHILIGDDWLLSVAASFEAA